MPHARRRNVPLDDFSTELPWSYGPLEQVASATTLTLPEDEDVVEITGTTTITALSDPRNTNPHFVMLYFAPGTGNVSMTAGLQRAFQHLSTQTGASWIRLYWDGTQWLEAGRWNFDGWHYIGAMGEPAFAGTWGNVGSGTPNAGYRREVTGGLRIVGYVTGGAAATVFTLPSGYYSALVSSTVPIWINAGAGSLSINTTGVVSVTGSAYTNAWLTSSHYF